MILLILCSALAQDQGETGRWIQRLSDDSVESRNEAETRLIETGGPALPGLQQALQNPDVEVQSRVKAIIAAIQRLDREREYDLQEKKRILEKRRRILGPPPAKDAGTFQFEGGEFTFRRLRFQDGLVIRTEALDHLSEDGRGSGITFNITGAADKDGKALEIERCGRCSPGVILIRQNAGPVRLTVKGSQQWFSLHKIAFKDPKDGDQAAVGDFTFRLSWPDLILHSERGWPKETLQSLDTHFTYAVRTGAASPSNMAAGGGGSGGHFSGTFSDKWWCSCKGGPIPVVEPPKPQLLRDFTASGGDGHRLEEVTGIEYVFRKPVVQPLEFTVEVPGP